MQPDAVLFDSDAFVGLLVNQDAHHDFMREYISQLAENQIVPTTTSSVVFETATLLSKRYNHMYARQFLEFLAASEFEIYDVTTEQRLKAQQLFGQLQTMHNSLIDCSNVVVATQLGIRHMVSFDRFYGAYELAYLSH